MKVDALKGVGPKIQEKLARLSIFTLQDLLFHLPVRYQDRTRLVAMNALRVGDSVAIEGKVFDVQLKYGRRRSLLCKISDGYGQISLRFFHFNARQKQQLEACDQSIRCFGEVRFGSMGLEMIHPEYSFVDDNQAMAVEEHLTPIYPTTEGLHQLTWRKLTDQALNFLSKDKLPDYFPEKIMEKFALPALTDAVCFLHRPSPDVSLAQLEAGQHPAQKRLAFEELLAHQLSLRKMRVKLKEDLAHQIDPKNLVAEFITQLPFKLTGAQHRVSEEIFADLLEPHPMLRLVQGDVGCGKTIVAAMAALRVVANDYQVAVMAPTEILAEQHTARFAEWFAPFNIQVVQLLGKQTAKQKRECLAQLETGEAKVVVGTHALFQQGVNFHKLALIIVDEQHRFGVHQRLALREKGVHDHMCPHQLIMTATPIPRTLAMTAYADLDCSIIDELPPGRKPVTTLAISSQRRDEVVDRICAVCAKGRQVYWVCTLIDDSEVLQCQAAETTAEILKAQLSQLRVGMLHGRMKSDQKQAVMAAFKSAEIDLLVATTVIEVGVDVPNANLMVIENPERLGLAQLHQLRGRVGRGATESYCVLLYKSPLSGLSKKRIQMMRKHHDGFAIAQFDLELRGPGEVLGTRQTGLMRFRIADLLRDRSMLPTVRDAADLILAENSDRVEPLIKRWLLNGEQYGVV